MLNDSEAYQKFTGHRVWYNKLWLSEQFGYVAGPAGLSPPIPSTYICRPIYNLNGMGLGAAFQYLSTGDEVLPGHFWCEIFEGDHRSIDFVNIDQRWVKTRCSLGIKSAADPFVFERWIKDQNFDVQLPSLFDSIIDHDCEYHISTINIEMIGDKIIEVHLRGSPDPDCDTIVPIFDHDQIYRWKQCGYRWVNSPEDGGGQLKVPRKGFMVTQR